MNNNFQLSSRLADFDIFIKRELTEIFEKDLENFIETTIIQNENFLASKIKGNSFQKIHDSKPKFKSIFKFIPDILIYDNINKTLYKNKNHTIKNCFLENEVGYPFYFSSAALSNTLTISLIEEIKKDQINKIANYFDYLTKFTQLIYKNETSSSSLHFFQIQLYIYTSFYVFLNEITTNLVSFIKDVYQNFCSNNSLSTKKEFETVFPCLFNNNSNGNNNNIKEESILF